MNKVEFQQKLDESIRLIEEGNYQEAVDQIDLLNLDSVRDTRILQLIAKAYEKCRRYEDAEDLLLQAKEVAPRGRGTLFHLCTLAIKAGNLGDAMIYYNQFCEVAKNDSERFVLQYRIAQAENKGDDELITILENFKGEEPDDRWMYELAKLYAINDRTNEALEVCDEITLWFYNGKYVQLAKELRAYLTGEPIEEEPYPAGNEVEVQTVTRKKTEEEPEEEKEEPVETPETVIEADAWDSDGVDGELFGAGTTETETKPEPDGPFMEEPEIERLIPGIDPDAFSREESSAYAGMTGTPVPVEEEDRSPIGRILAELPKLAEGSRPSKEEMYRIVPEFEAIAEKVAPEVVETAKEAAEDVAVTFSETLTETPAAEFTETATETATEFAEAAAGIAATGAFAKEAAAEFTDILTEEVPAAENLTENAVKKAGAGLSEMEFDLDELDRFTQEQLQPQKAEEAVQKAEEEAARIAEEEARKAEEETARIAEEEARKAEEEAKRLAEEEAARIAEEEARKAEEEAKRLAEEEAHKAEEEAARIAEEEARKAEEEAAKLAEETQKLEETAEQKLEETAELITEPEKVEDQAEAPEPEKVEEPAGEPETEKVEEPADDAPDMETEVVAALTPEAEAKPEPAETAAPAESTEEAPEESAFAGMKVNPGPEDAYWNFVVVGERPEDTLERAKAAMKALSTREGLAEKMRMTKIPAAKLNGIQIGAAFGQFRDKMVIIENAAGLSDAQLEDFAKLLPEAERSTVLCFTDTKGNMASLFGRVSALTGAFDAVFEEADATEESVFRVILDYFDAEDAVFTEAGEAAAKEYVREELLKEGGRAEELAKEFAAKVIHTAEHGGMFGLFSGHVDDEGFLHVTDKNVRKAVKK